MPKVVRFHEIGEAEVLQIDDIPMPDAAENEIVIKVHAFGLNRAEVMFRRGQYPQYEPVLPSTLGYEAAGEVLAVGPNVTAFRPGDRVSTIPSFKMGRYWSYGEVARFPLHAVAKFPEHLSWREAASIWMPYMTALGALVEYGDLQPGAHVVITAASASVGIAAIQVAKAIGARTIAVTRGADKRAFIENQGPDHVIVSNDEDVAGRVLDITGGKGAEMIFDPVAGPGVADLARATAYHGRIFVYGRLDPRPAIFPVGLGLAKGIAMRGYSLFEVVNFPDVMERAKQRVYDGLTAGIYKPVVDTCFPLEEIVQAHRHMESNTQRGKITVTVQ